MFEYKGKEMKFYTKKNVKLFPEYKTPFKDIKWLMSLVDVELLFGVGCYLKAN